MGLRAYLGVQGLQQFLIGHLPMPVYLAPPGFFCAWESHRLRSPLGRELAQFAGKCQMGGFRREHLFLGTVVLKIKSHRTAGAKNLEISISFKADFELEGPTGMCTGGGQDRERK